MTDYPDLTLLKLIASDEDVEIRNQAFTVFYNRYHSFVWNSLRRVCGLMADNEEFCRNLLNNTFYRVYRHRKPFVVDENKSPKEKQRNVEGWLLKIAKREFSKLQSDGRYPPDEAVEAYEMMVQASSNGAASSTEELMIRKAFALLSERDQSIIYTYWHHYSPGKGSQAKNLPEPVLAELGAKYKITPDNIRQIISRGNKKIKEYLERTSALTNHNTRTGHVEQ